MHHRTGANTDLPLEVNDDTVSTNQLEIPEGIEYALDGVIGIIFIIQRLFYYLLLKIIFDDLLE